MGFPGGTNRGLTLKGQNCKLIGGADRGLKGQAHGFPGGTDKDLKC